MPASEPAKFWQYVHNGKIHLSFLLHRTLTGRSATASPNARNFPKHGRGSMKDVVKAFRSGFSAPLGWKVIECDLSQMELRLIAWYANEKTTIDLYRRGADIHAMTAASTMGTPVEEIKELDEDTKGVNVSKLKPYRHSHFLYVRYVPIPFHK